MNQLWRWFLYLTVLLAATPCCAPLHDVSVRPALAGQDTLSEGPAGSFAAGVFAGLPGNSDDLLREIVDCKNVDRFFRYANTGLYPRFLSCCFVHLIDFLELGKHMRASGGAAKQAAYYTRVFETFDLLLVRCRYVNAYAFSWLLDKMPGYLEPLCAASSHAAEEIIIRGARRALLENFKLLKKDSERWFKTMAAPIVEELEASGDIAAAHELRVQVTQFLDTSVDKLVWSPRENIDTWVLVKNIGSKLHELFNCGIITTVSDLNRLIWKLICRYQYFIDCVGPQLPQSLFEAIRDDVINKRCLFLTLEEPDARLQTKTDFLLQMMTGGVAKSLTHEINCLDARSSVPTLLNAPTMPSLLHKAP